MTTKGTVKMATASIEVFQALFHGTTPGFRAKIGPLRLKTGVEVVQKSPLGLRPRLRGWRFSRRRRGPTGSGPPAPPAWAGHPRTSKARHTPAPSAVKRHDSPLYTLAPTPRFDLGALNI